MALYVLKEGTFSAVKCRLGSPPGSPRRANTQATLQTTATSSTTFTSRVLSVLDAQVNLIDFESDRKHENLKTCVKPRSGGHTPEASAPSKHVHRSMSNHDTRVFEAPSVSVERRTNKGNPEQRPDHLPLNTTIHPEAVSVQKQGQLYSYKDYLPSPSIVYARYEQEANKAAEKLQGPLGFDMEWRIILRRGKQAVQRKTAVIQLSDKKTILIIHVSAIQKIPQKVKDIIENPAVAKVGANIKNDGQKLNRDYGVFASNLVELGALARQADPTFVSKRSIVSLANIVELYCEGKTLEKGPVRTSDWERKPLSHDQLKYAANDAHSALMAFTQLMELAATNGQILDPATYSSSIARSSSSGITPISDLGPETNLPSRPSSEASSTTQATLETAQASGGLSSLPKTGGNGPPNLQHVRAYRLWHHRQLPLDDICVILRSKENPLARGTVITYVMEALKQSPPPPFSLDRLKTFVQQDAASWARHGAWIRRYEAISAALTSVVD